MRGFRCGLACALLCAQAAGVGAAGPLFPKKKAEVVLPACVPWEGLNDKARAVVRHVLEKPILSARGPAETTYGGAEHFAYFLDHPDRAVTAWRRLGAKCVSITPRGDGRFGYVDENGSDVSWETIYKDERTCLWYAEGKVKPSAVLPMVPIKALVVLTHSGGKAPDGKKIVHHQSELFLQTDSKAAAALTKMMGKSAQKVAEEGLGQLQLFFSGLSWYLERHPDRAEGLLRPESGVVPASLRRP